MKSMKTLFSLFLLLSLSAFCWAATNPPALKVGVAGKKRGDIIAPLLDVQIAAWCDFDKQIVKTKSGVLCSYVGDRTASAEAKGKYWASRKRGASLPKDLSSTPYEMSEYSEEA